MKLYPSPHYLYPLIIIVTTFSGVARRIAGGWPWIANGLFAVQLLLAVSPAFHSLHFRKHARNIPLKILAGNLLFLSFFAANPLNVSIAHGIYGLVVHMIFCILLLFYLQYRNYFHRKSFTAVYVIILLTETITGNYQYQKMDGMEPDFDTERAADPQDYALVGDGVRASGTFPYLAGFSAFTHFTTLFSCSLIKRNPGHPITILALFATAYCSLISGSRWAVAFFLLTLLAFLFFEIRKIEIARRTMLSMLLVAVMLALNNWVGDPLSLGQLFWSSANNMLSRFSGNAEEGLHRVRQDLLDAFVPDFAYPITGIGLGATCRGAIELFGLNPLLTGVPFEGELGRLIIEGGYPLLVGRFLVLGLILRKMCFSNLFKTYLFFILGLFAPLVYNCYGSIFMACGLVLLDQAFSGAKDPVVTLLPGKRPAPT